MCYQLDEAEAEEVVPGDEGHVEQGLHLEEVEEQDAVVVEEEGVEEEERVDDPLEW